MKVICEKIKDGACLIDHPEQCEHSKEHEAIITDNYSCMNLGTWDCWDGKRFIEVKCVRL